MNLHYQQREKSGETAAINFIPNRFSSQFSTSPTNGPRLPSLQKAGTHSAFGERSHTSAYTPKQGVFQMGCYYYPRTVSHVSETLRGQGVERQTLPLLGLGRVCSRRTQRACGTVMRSCASLFRRRRGPAGLRDLFLLLSKLQLARPALRAFCVCEVGVVSLPSVCSACCQSVPCAGVKTGNLPISEVG